MELMLVLWYVNYNYAKGKEGRRPGLKIDQGMAPEFTALTPLLRIYGLSLTRPQYTAAAKQSALDPTSRAISSLASVVRSDTKLQSILSSPLLQDSDKASIIAELEKHTGGADKSGTVKNFLSALAEHNRLGLLEGVCTKFAELMSASKGEIELIITSAAVCLLAGLS